MPAYIQSKAFAYKGWQPPNFRVYVSQKAAKDVRKDAGQHGNNGETRKLDDCAAPPSQPLTSDHVQHAEDVGEMASTSLEAGSIQDHLLRSSVEPGELDAMVALDTDEVVMGNNVTHEPETGENVGGDAEVEPDRDGALDGENEEDSDNKDENGRDEKLDEENEAKVAPARKKPKPRKKKSSAEDQVTQSLGDKVILSFF